MGNGAGVQSFTDDSLIAKYHEIESRCKSGYYFQNPKEFAHVLKQAISYNLLDNLEILAVSGDMSKAYAVHVAAKLGKLECLDLLMSAGFPGDSKDRHDRTPLHCACSIQSQDTALCVSLLLINCPNSVKAYDREGNTPVHIAVMNSNLLALQVMKDQKVNFNSIRNIEGYSPLEMAKKLHIQLVVDFFKGKVNSTVQMEAKSKESDEVSQARIMAVWEKFFENAFLQAGLNMDDDEASLNDDYRYHDKAPGKKKSTTSKSSSKAAATSSSSKSDYHSYRASFMATEDDEYDMYAADEKSAAKRASQTLEEASPFSTVPYVDIQSWMSKVALLYTDEEAYGTSSYGLIDTSTMIQQWLSTYLDELYYNGWQHWFLFAQAESLEMWPLPQTMEEVALYGWMTFYDRQGNYCQWMNVVTGKLEDYLPLLQGMTIDWLEYYGLSPYYEDDGYLSVWVAADQTVAKAWILVTLDESSGTSDVGEYYLNLQTGDTSWYAPTNWDSLVMEWNGWLLCCTETNPHQHFWYDPHSGDSQWVEV